MSKLLLKNVYIGRICFEGDSRSMLSKEWTLQSVSDATNNERIYGGYRVSNCATSGANLETIAERGSTIDALLTGGNDILSLWSGVNNAGSTAQQIYDALKSYCMARKLAGWKKIIICSEIDAQDEDRNIRDWHTVKWPGLNALLNADYSFADVMADLGGNVNLQDATNNTYFNVDLIHPTAAGYLIVRGIVSSALELLI